jgi:hypothetical protein
VNWNSRTGLLIERSAIGVASLILSVGAIALLSGYFAGNDTAGISGNATGPGTEYRDLGDQILPAGRLAPEYDSTPPTSGPHVSEPVQHDGAVLNNNQLLTALSLGNVVIAYGGPAPPAGLQSLANSIAGPFTPSLATDGLAVILAREPGVKGLIGLAWTLMVRVSSVNDPLLSEFARSWLGKGAHKRSLPAS